MVDIKDENQYLKALEEYWKSMESTRPSYPNKETEYLAQEIREYKSSIVSERFTKIIFVFAIELVSSMVMAVAVIWSANEILKFDVLYTVRNIIAISILFFVGRTRLKYTGKL